MKKRTALIFSAGLFLMVIAVLFVLLINGSLKNEGDIVLPQGSAQVEEAVDIAKRNRRHIEEITVDAGNVQNVIATLSRPAGYSYSAEIVYYYEAGSYSFVSTVWASAGRSRIVTADSGGNIRKQLIYTDSSVYIWGSSDVTYYKGERGAFSVEDEAGLPTYESVLELETSDILSADVRDYNGRLCVYLTSSYGLGRYTREWYVDIDSGLLYACSTKENGELIYSAVCRDMSIGEQDASLFSLPSGELPE